MATTGARVGERLRAIRRQKGLSLHDVEARSNLEFKASVLGAYERGERAISVPRLLRLAEIYEVPAGPVAAARPRGRDQPRRERRLDRASNVRLHDRPRAAARPRRSRRADRFPFRDVDPARAPGLQRPHAHDPPLRPPGPRVGHGPQIDELGARLEQLGLRAARLSANPAEPPSGSPSATLRSGLGSVATTSTSVKILVPGNHLMVGLLGQRDELLRLVEAAFPVQILVRGNEITVTGDGPDAERVGRLFEELVVLLEQGHELDREGLGPLDRDAEGRPAPERGAHHRSRARPQDDPSEDGGAEALRRRGARQHGHVRRSARPAPARATSRSRSRCRRCRPKHVNRIILTRPAVEAGERLGFLPGDMLAKVDPYLRPLYDALYDMLEPESRGAADGAGHDRGRAARVHARPHAQRLVHHPRRGAEHDARADEDVPHPARLRFEGGRHRRRHADRPARGQAADRACCKCATSSKESTASCSCELGSPDVVRHRIVQDIVDAYERHEG